MAATPKPIRKEVKKRLTELRKMYKSDPDIKTAGIEKSHIKHMKKQDKKDVKKIVKRQMKI